MEQECKGCEQQKAQYKICRCCQLINKDFDQKLCKYCNLCDAWLCESCLNDIPKRMAAAGLNLGEKIIAKFVS